MVTRTLIQVQIYFYVYYILGVKPFLKNPHFKTVILLDTQLLEIYALEIQMYTEQKNNKQLKELYERSLKVRSAIPHPLIMSVIRECGGKMHLRSGDYEKVIVFDHFS